MTREELKKALEECLRDEDCVCATVSVNADATTRIEVPKALIREAVRMLGNMEPRLLKIDELAEGVPVWLEFRREPSGYDYDYDSCDDMYWVLTKHRAPGWWNLPDRNYGYNDEYNRLWRCWTSMPYADDAKATPWDALHQWHPVDETEKGGKTK